MKKRLLYIALFVMQLFVVLLLSGCGCSTIDNKYVGTWEEQTEISPTYKQSDEARFIGHWLSEDGDIIQLVEGGKISSDSRADWRYENNNGEERIIISRKANDIVGTRVYSYDSENDKLILEDVTPEAVKNYTSADRVGKVYNRHDPNTTYVINQDNTATFSGADGKLYEMTWEYPSERDKNCILVTYKEAPELTHTLYSTKDPDILKIETPYEIYYKKVK